MKKLYILFENEDWMPPLERELKAAKIDYEKWFMNDFHFDISAAPPEGVFLNRMSPSSHTRSHENSVDATLNCLYWLESHGRKVINGSSVFQLEISKVLQYSLLQAAGIKTPKTIAITDGSQDIKTAARKMKLPFITKHNRGGKGLGVRIFQSYEEFDHYAETSFENAADHITLLQDYIKPKDQSITRVELVGDQCLYAIKASTENGFELCPAEACEIGDTFCPVGESEPKENRQELFTLRKDLAPSIAQSYLDFMKSHKIDIAGIEFIEDENGDAITYDINTTTNYSPGVEEQNNLNGMKAIVDYIKPFLD